MTHQFHSLVRPMLLLAALACSGCAGDGEGLDQNGRPIDSTGGGNGTLTADLQSIQDNVFTPICTACHAGANAPLGLRLDAANSYNMLVGIPSVEVPSLQRVAPGDPNSSYIIQKLEGTAAVGERMPRGGPPLSAATIQVIRQWIAQGAAQAAARSFSDAAPRKGNSIAAGSLLQVVPESLVVGFDTPLDASLVSVTTVMLQRQMGEDDFEDLATHARLNPANAFVILIRPQLALETGHYRLLLRGRSGGGVLADTSGQPLGDDYVFEFGLEAQ